jgi:hypothetical protein
MATTARGNTWKKVYAFGNHVEYLISETGQKIGEVTDHRGHGGSDDVWFVARDCRSLPCRYLGEYDSAENARAAVCRAVSEEKALQEGM